MSSNEAQPELVKHDATILDLAFIMDCTGSMYPYIESATENIRKIVEEIVVLEKSDIKLALVEFRDHPPQDDTFVTKSHDFTGSVRKMKEWLEGCEAEGGGDLPEAVADGLQDALDLSWREVSTKIVVLISDAPPHGLIRNDTFPNGCPKGIDALKVVKKMAEKGITLYTVGCEPTIVPYKEFFTAIAYTTGGQYVPLRNAKLLAKVIVGGAVEEISLEKLMEGVQIDVDEQRSQGVTDEAVLTEYVGSRLKGMGAVASQLRMNDSSVESASKEAVNYSKMKCMSDLKKAYLENEDLFDLPVHDFSAGKGMLPPMNGMGAIPPMNGMGAIPPMNGMGAIPPMKGENEDLPDFNDFATGKGMLPPMKGENEDLPDFNDFATGKGMLPPMNGENEDLPDFNDFATGKGMLPPMNVESSNGKEDVYESRVGEIQMEQVERMVQKALRRKK